MNEGASNLTFLRRYLGESVHLHAADKATNETQMQLSCHLQSSTTGPLENVALKQRRFCSTEFRTEKGILARLWQTLFNMMVEISTRLMCDWE